MRFHAPAIYYFQAVRRAGSIRAAARVLNVASSAVNRQILKLEEDIGTPLFERTIRGLKLTSVGEMFARHVMTVTQDEDRFRSDLQSLSGTWQGTIRIASIEALAGSLLPDVMKWHRDRAKRVTFSARTMGSFEVHDVLVRGEADIGIAFALRHSPELRQVALKRFRLGAVVANDHPLASKRKVTLPQCMPFPFILAFPELSIHDLLQPLLARLPQGAEPAIQTNSMDLMRELAERSVAISFQTQLGIERHLEAGRLSFLPLYNGGRPVWSDLGVYVRSERALPAYMESCLQDLVRELDEREQRENAAFA
ncbi:transcriptional regulator [Bradyrhizobium sp. LTSP885]|uniref:LysR family transcriptional regulator n=1 Tax=Bradyrhizobium sp. LTSP885 TaxID=1619232 RepID=UPI0005CB35C1|nr:LysR family transcriptional regulator [Bradyrhizobium sp. LTSP885]KJC51269.1 transcriptional regulator [Bradyrhizobium sp. LTSP885]